MSAATQGNGYDWASTMGWLSGVYDRLAEEAEEYERQGKKVAIVPSSFIGASSGSGITLVHQGLLRNTNLSDVTRTLSNGDRALNAEEARRISKALRFMSLGADLTLKESFGFLVNLGWNLSSDWLTSRFKNLRTRIRNRLLGENEPLVPNIWTEALSAKVAAADFGKMIFFAQYAGRDIIENPIDIYSDREFRKLRRLMGESPLLRDIFANVDEVTDLALPPNQVSADAMEQWQVDALDEYLQVQSNKANSMINRFVKSNIGWVQRWTSRFTGIRPAATSLSEERQAAINVDLREPVSMPMLPGFVTGTFAVPFESRQSLYDELAQNANGIPYHDLRVYLLMDESTAQALLNSSFYRDLVMNNDPFIKRYVIAVVDQSWAAMNASIREPRLINELIGSPSDNNIRIKSLYYPERDTEFNFQLSSTQKSEEGLMVIGGFPYKEILAFLPTVYTMDKWEELRNAGYSVVKRKFMFGVKHKEGQTEGTFALDQITQRFSSRLSDSIDSGLVEMSMSQFNLNDYTEWLQNWDRVFRGFYMGDEVGQLMATQMMRDNLQAPNFLPAAAKGQSRLLTYANYSGSLESAPINWLLGGLVEEDNSYPDPRRALAGGACEENFL